MSKIFKKFAAVMLCVIMLVSVLATPVAFAAEDTVQNPMYVPLRPVFEAQGAEVDWDDERFVVMVELEGTMLEFFIGNINARADGELFALSFPVIMDGGIARISVLDVADFFVHESGAFNSTILTSVFASFQVMEQLSLPGVSVALVDLDSGFTWTAGFGFADVENEVFVDENTLFSIGSISKTVTALAVMQLVEDGVIDLDTPIVEYLPDFYIPSSELVGGDYSNITTRMLLTHTSGIVPNIVGYRAVTSDAYNYAFFNNFLSYLSNYDMISQEGTVFTYNNNGYNVLGILVAAMTGDDNYFDDFASFMNESVLAPANMPSSTFVLDDTHLPYLAGPYANAVTRGERLYFNSIPTGGMFSSAADMAVFMNLLLSDDGTLVNRGTIARMMAATDFDFSTTLGGMEYGLGFLRMVSMDGLRTVGHNGALIYYYADMILDTQNNIGVFVVTNGANGIFATSPLSTTILASAVVEKTGSVDALNLMPPRLNPAATPIEVPTAELERLQGLYLGQTYFIIEFDDYGVLNLILPGEPVSQAFPLEPMSDGSFLSDAGSFWFDEAEVMGESVIILRQGELGHHMIAVGLNEEDFLVSETFERWIGTFAAQPRVNEVSFVSAIVFGEDSRGIATMNLVQRVPISPVLAVQTTDDAFTIGINDVAYDAEGIVQSFELLGMRFVRS